MYLALIATTRNDTEPYCQQLPASLSPSSANKQHSNFTNLPKAKKRKKAKDAKKTNTQSDTTREARLTTNTVSFPFSVRVSNEGSYGRPQVNEFRQQLTIIHKVHEPLPDTFVQQHLVLGPVLVQGSFQTL